jgi:hypothetical protein
MSKNEKLDSKNLSRTRRTVRGALALTGVVLAAAAPSAVIKPSVAKANTGGITAPNANGGVAPSPSGGVDTEALRVSRLSTSQEKLNNKANAEVELLVKKAFSLEVDEDKPGAQPVVNAEGQTIFTKQLSMNNIDVDPSGSQDGQYVVEFSSTANPDGTYDLNNVQSLYLTRNVGDNTSSSLAFTRNPQNGAWEFNTSITPWGEESSSNPISHEALIAPSNPGLHHATAEQEAKMFSYANDFMNEMESRSAIEQSLNLGL